ncbi:cysteine protease ATG4 [Punica granatum]|uniref:Cysteine protease n=2 Tax=Punica granatum TaxID=22663 RepID=A0A6P8CJ01_PUNGR|nr:cysteine protease ATG4 [Punica granatum]
MKGFGFRERDEATDNRKPPSSSSSSSSSSSAAAASSWSTLFSSAFSIFDPYRHSQSSCKHRHHAWASAVKRIVSGGPMRRIHESFVLGSARTGLSNSTSDIWLLGVRYNVSSDDEAVGLAAFEQDFSSRVIMTYRKGFDAIGDSSYTSDVNWGCMLRSSQMLVAQALLFHRLGRSWRKPSDKLLTQEYIDILHHFGDTEACPFSIHSLIQSGKAYGLAAGSWVGPYAMCRSWEILVRSKREELINHGEPALPMAIYVVSGDEDGERGGAPVLCIEDAKRHCSEFSRGQSEWAPILLLVPLVLGLGKVNPRYVPSLRAIFSFPQSLGVLGGKPGASTYMIGVQDEEVFYLDPHEVQPAVTINRDNLEADTSSYHCSVIRHITLDSLDPSLAIGFYCRDKDDFDNFCSRASELAKESNGAPLFTVAETPSSNSNSNCASRGVSHGDPDEGDYCRDEPTGPTEGEDDWQFL